MLILLPTVCIHVSVFTSVESFTLLKWYSRCIVNKEIFLSDKCSVMGFNTIVFMQVCTLIISSVIDAFTGKVMQVNTLIGYCHKICLPTACNSLLY